MRRFVWTLTLLILAAAAVFFVGWIQLRVEPGSWAVLVTKTGGVDPRTLTPGTFRWTAAALLPTNVRLLSFKPVSGARTISMSGELPSAAAYGAFMAGKPDFSWALSLRISASPEPDYLPVLVERHGIKDDASLAAWLDAEIEAAAASIRETALGLAMDVARSRSSADGQAYSALASAARESHPGLADLSVAVLSAAVPDIALYDEARAMYGSYLERFRAAVEPALTEASAAAAGDQVRMDSLKRYGELLSQYPWLVDFLAIEAGIAPRPMYQASPQAAPEAPPLTAP